MKYKLSKAISVITVAPLIAFYALTSLFFYKRNIFGDASWYIILIFFLTILPLSAYVLEYVIPSVRKQGRNGERKLAFLMGIIGYVSGTALSFAFNAPGGVKMIFTSYLMSAGLLIFLNVVIKLKASGHACGISGPFVFLLYFIGKKIFCTILLLIPVFWARLSMGRHTYKELLSGTAAGIAATTFAVFMHVHM